MDRNLRQAQLNFDAQEAPCQSHREGEHHVETNLDGVEVVFDCHITKDGEVELREGSASLVLADGKHIVPFNEEGLETFIKLYETEMLESAQPNE